MATGFTVNGAELGSTWMTKSYMLDRYPELSNVVKSPGLWTWGFNNFGQLGDSSRSPRSTPVQTVAGGTNWKQMYLGGYWSMGIKTDGTLWSWGRNAQGQLGDGTSADKSSPVVVSAGATTWKQVAGGYYMSIGLKTDGTIWTWGSNYDGSLGNGNAAVTKVSTPIQVGALTTWKTIGGGGNNAGAIKNDGTLWMWGDDTYNQVGNNSLGKFSSPVQTFAGGTNWSKLAVGLTVGAIKTDGTLWTWGANGYGSGGRGTTGVIAYPLQVGSDTTWKQVSVTPNGKTTMGGIKTDGTLWMWGYGGWGNRGDGTTTDVNSPVQVAGGGTNWYRVSAGYVSGGIKTDGTLWMWGYASYGTEGNGTNSASINRSSPTQVGTSANWKSLAASWHFLAIRDDTIDFGSGTL